MIYKKVEINGNVYTLRKPVGRVGAIHFGLITKCVSQDVVRGKTLDQIETNLEEEVDYERIMEVFVEWSEKVLPHLIVEGPYKYEDMPGEDQFAVFMAMVQTIKVSKDFFRVIDQ